MLDTLNTNYVVNEESLFLKYTVNIRCYSGTLIFIFNFYLLQFSLTVIITLFS